MAANGHQNGVTSSLPEVTYGFIGIGVMGFPMACHLRAKIPQSSSLIICEVVEAQVKNFLAENEGVGQVEVASSPKEVAEQAAIVITMLPHGHHVKEVFTNPKTGLLSANPSHPILFMECSTIDIATSNEMKNLATSAGHQFVDAPVSGGPNGAHAGTLTFMIGGSSELFDLVRPLAEAMGKKESIFHCGDAGAGLATKQINNYLSAVSMIGTSEAFNMGRLYGLNPKTLASVINVSTGRNYNSAEQNPVKGITPTSAAARDFEGGFSMELCVGVLEQAMQLRQQVGAKSLLGDVVLDAFHEAMQDERCKGKDYRSFYRWFADI